MERILTYHITLENQGKPIDLYLKSIGFSAQNIIALKKIPRSILVNGNWEYVTYRLKSGDVLTIHILEHISSPHIPPVFHPLSIIYEDEDILVLNKPADMPIHPSFHHYENTLANAVMYYYNSQNIPCVFRCINRLDRDTTGLTLLAKHMVSGGILSSMVSKRKIKRTYLGIVSGCPAVLEGTIDAPIARVPGSAIEREVNFETGERAITHYHVEKTLPNNNTLISFQLETGRTHQIRVHTKYMGHPLLGDFLYNPDTTLISRQALHAYSLSFCHPVTRQPLHFTAPLPADMKELL